MYGRPLKLIRKDLMKKLYSDRNRGVYYTHLVKKYNLGMRINTLKKLLSFYELYLTTNTKNEKEIIHNSLFPLWLKGNVQVQKFSEYIYTGIFPYGKWETAPKKGKRLLYTEDRTNILNIINSYLGTENKNIKILRKLKNDGMLELHTSEGLFFVGKDVIDHLDFTYNKKKYRLIGRKCYTTKEICVFVLRRDA